LSVELVSVGLAVSTGVGVAVGLEWVWRRGRN